MSASTRLPIYVVVVLVIATLLTAEVVTEASIDVALRIVSLASGGALVLAARNIKD